DDRFPLSRPRSTVATRSDNVMLRADAISLSPDQNSSSRLTLVLCPPITTDRFNTGEPINLLTRRQCRGSDPVEAEWLFFHGISAPSRRFFIGLTSTLSA